ncbi:uncharacterized protein TNCV_4107291 [Trichonephila clavipes]|nr:uncharacterized protein TNCV_4107291 [Trichonephila clavipes]
MLALTPEQDRYSTPIDADLREQILKLSPYQPEGNFQKDYKGRRFSPSYYSFIPKAGQKIERKWLCYSTRLRVAYCQALLRRKSDCKSLESDVLNFLNTLDINLAKCQGQGYDGAANMIGAYGGLQKLITDKQPRANYVHCSTHNLNLVLKDACNNVPQLSIVRSVHLNLWIIAPLNCFITDKPISRNRGGSEHPFFRATLFEDWSRLEVRAVIQFLWAKNVSASAMSRQHVAKLCHSFLSGRREVKSRSMTEMVRLSSSTTEMNDGEMIQNGLRVTMREILSELGLSYGKVQYIVSNVPRYSKTLPRNHPLRPCERLAPLSRRPRLAGGREESLDMIQLIYLFITQ